jgi:hypothetical protein
VKQYIGPAQIKNTLQTQPGITYAQISISMHPHIEQEQHTNQSHQQTSVMNDLKKHDEKPV